MRMKFKYTNLLKTFRSLHHNFIERLVQDKVYSFKIKWVYLQFDSSLRGLLNLKEWRESGVYIWSEYKLEKVESVYASKRAYY